MRRRAEGALILWKVCHGTTRDGAGIIFKAQLMCIWHALRHAKNSLAARCPCRQPRLGVAGCWPASEAVLVTRVLHMRRTRAARCCWLTRALGLRNPAIDCLPAACCPGSTDQIVVDGAEKAGLPELSPQRRAAFLCCALRAPSRQTGTCARRLVSSYYLTVRLGEITKVPLAKRPLSSVWAP